MIENQKKKRIWGLFGNIFIEEIKVLIFTKIDEGL